MLPSQATAEQSPGDWLRLRLVNFCTGCRYLYKLTTPLFAPEKRLKTCAYLVAIAALMWANTKINVQISYATNDVFTSVARKDPQSVRDHYYYVCLQWTLLVTPVAVYYAYLRNRLAIWDRETLTEHFLGGLFSHQAYYKLLEYIRKKLLDNPDQRLTGDIDSCSNSEPGILITLTDSGVQLYAWTGVLWNISQELTYYVLAYACFGTLAVMIIGNALIALTNKLMKSDSGDLRHELLTVSQDARAIAFYQAEDCAKRLVMKRLQIVIKTLVDIARRNRNISMFTTLFNGLVPLIAPWFIGGLYADNQLPEALEKFGTVTQGGLAVVNLVGAFTAIMNQYPGIAAFTAIVFRLGSLDEYIEECQVERLPADKRIKITEGDGLVFDNVTVLGSDLEREYVRGLTFAMEKGESLAIMGADGVGKTELLMVLAGLSSAGHGKLQRPSFDDLMFVTDVPYLPKETTLRDVMSRSGNMKGDEEIRRALRLVNLEALEETAGGLDVEQDWSDLLKSPGEQQRLSLARIFCRRPSYVVIDEGTAAVDHETEKLIFGTLMGMGTTVVIATNDDRQVKYCSWVMTMPGDASYKICRASDYKPEKKE